MMSQARPSPRSLLKQRDKSCGLDTGACMADCSVAILLYASSNAAFGVVLWSLFPSLYLTPPVALSMYGDLVVMALLIIAATRGRLSYERDLRETARSAPVTDRQQEKGEARASI